MRPAPIKIYNEPFKACGGNVCLTPKEAQRSLDNKVEIGRWMGEANGVMDYYENRKVIPGAAARRF